ncbi:MAG: histidine kinase [Acidimicrobiales bacterium]
MAALGLLWFLGGLSEGRDPLAAGALAAGMVGLPAVAGGAGRTRRLYLEAVEERLAVAERERDERARQAIAAERARLARELHDVVAHHVSLIGVQAGAARVSLDRHPDGARRALAGIEESSRQAVTELHQLLDVLRPLHPPTDGRPDGMAKPDGTAKPDSTAKPDGTAKPSGIPIGTAPDAEGPTPIPPPAPGLERLPALVEQWCRAGMAVRGGGDLAAVCAAVGPTGPISPALSTTCYRIVEEALTNAARHGAAGTVWVTVALEPTGLRLEVRNPLGAGPPTAAGVGAGRGLVGMAERAAPFDGRVTTGPHEGGFVVEACFPLDALAAGSRR